MANLSESFVASKQLNEDLCYGKAWPLPRNSLGCADDIDKFEVVIVGAGPAGLLLNLQLARLGLSDNSLLCIDARSVSTNAGHADGVNARTLEILGTMGLDAEIRRDGNLFSEVGIWTQSPQDPSKLQALATTPFMINIPVRFERLKTIHQGRMERILNADLSKYSKRGVRYSTSAQKVCIDAATDPEYPIIAELEQDGKIRTVRAKYLVGADGAHSVVRRSMNVGMQGEITDRIWGVMDFIVDTDFPDIRRPCIFQSSLGEGRGDALIIPRERLSDGNYLTRLYIDMTNYEDGSGLPNGHNDTEMDSKAATKSKRAEITIDAVLEKGAKFMSPFRFKMKAGTHPFWWASYSVGQRLADNFSIDDSTGMPRVFLVGDACHTHSPRQGQGMNLSMQDSHNLAWKLAHSILGLAPDVAALLKSYERERQPAASRVLFFDKRWNQSTMSRDEMLREAAEQVLGCAVDYDGSFIVGPKGEDDLDHYPVTGTDYTAGVLRPGRRLFNVTVRRFADGSPRDIHDDLRADGRWRIILLCASDFPKANGQSLAAVTKVCDGLVDHTASSSSFPSFPPGVVEVSILQPDMAPKWTIDRDLPACVKEVAEMRLYCATSDVYATYGVDVSKGAIAVVRPDGHVGLVARLDNVSAVEKFLSGVLVTV